MYNPLYRGANAKAPSRGLSTGYQNGTLSTITKTIPVSSDTNGQIAITDVSSESSALSFVGVTNESIPSSASGQVISGGRIENVTLVGFSVGDAVYVGKSGTLINAKPSIGVASFVAGDWVIFIGVVVKNEFDSLKIDIQAMIEVIGQL